MFKKIYSHLKEKGIDVYSIGQHEGLCNDPYVVIKENSENPFQISLTNKLIDIIIFYPIGKYSELSDYMLKLKKTLKELTFLKSDGEITPVIIDNEVKAYTCSIKYQIFKRRL